MRWKDEFAIVFTWWKDEFAVVFTWKLIMVKRGVYGCSADKGWTVVALYSVSLPKLKPLVTF